MSNAASSRATRSASQPRRSTRDGRDRLCGPATEVGPEAQHHASQDDVAERLRPLDGQGMGDLGADGVADRQQRQRPPGVGIGDGADLGRPSTVQAPEAVGVRSRRGRRLRRQGPSGRRRRRPSALRSRSIEQLVDDLGGDRAPGGQLAAGDGRQARCAVARVIDQQMPPRDAVGEPASRTSERTPTLPQSGAMPFDAGSTRFAPRTR